MLKPELEPEIMEQQEAQIKIETPELDIKVQDIGNDSKELISPEKKPFSPKSDMMLSNQKEQQIVDANSNIQTFNQKMEKKRKV